MGSEKALTVSVAAYNVADCLGKALESCLVPSAEKLLEVLIIDDGSTDATAAVASSYSEKLPGVFKLISKLNGGYGSTVNTGIERASGKYFTVLDGDDEFDRDGLEALLNTLASCDADLVVTPFVEVRENIGTENCRDLFPTFEQGDYLLDEVMPGVEVAMHAFTFKTSLLRESGIFITEHCFYTDTEIALMPLAFATTVRIEHYPVYRYALGIAGQSVSLGGRRKHADDVYKVFEKLFGFYKEHEFPTAQKKQMFAYNLASAASACYESAFLQKISWGNWRKLVDFDRMLKQSPEIYNADVYLNKTAVFRKMHIAYPVCARRAVRLLEG